MFSTKVNPGSTKLSWLTQLRGYRPKIICNFHLNWYLMVEYGLSICCVTIVITIINWDTIPIIMAIYIQIYITGWWFQPLWEIWKSVGIIIPNIWKVKKKSMVPTHQADNIHYFVKLHPQMHPIPWYFSNGVPERQVRPQQILSLG